MSENVFDQPPAPPAPPAEPPAPTIEELRARLGRLKRQARRRELLGSLKEFVHAFWTKVEPDKTLVWNWHLDELCTVLEAISKGQQGFERVVVNVPPGTMKSLLISVFWPAWEWARKPQLRYFTASYSDHLTIRDNLRVRDICASPDYQDLFALRFKGDQNAKERFDTTAKGWRIASSVGGAGTGEHPDRIIIDDPSSAQGAKSDVKRQEVNDWFDRTVSTRGKTRGVVVIVVMQRLHEEDLSGHLLAKGDWLHIMLPMRFEAKRADPRDRRTEENELLWPTLFTEKIVRALETDLAAYGTAGQLQQRPAPEGGGLFKKHWFEIVDALPADAKIRRRVRGWDTAGTEGDGDYTVGVLLAETRDGIVYVEDVVRDQLDAGPDGVDLLMLNTARMDGRAVSIREEKEGGSAGKAVVKAHSKMLRGYDYEGVLVTGDKVTRARPFRAQCAAGNVKLLRGEWNKPYLDELSGFPVAAKDDQVDGSSCSYNALLTEVVPGGVLAGKASWGK